VYGESFYLNTRPDYVRQWGWWSDGGFGEKWTMTDQTTISVVSSVPEPSGIAMSVIGLGLVGLVARRRQRAARR